MHDNLWGSEYVSIKDNGIDMKCTCPACPVQYEGTVDGIRAYFRARYNHWTFTIGPEPIMGMYKEPDKHASWQATFGTGDFDAGYMPGTIAIGLIKGCVEQWRTKGKQNGLTDLGYSYAVSNDEAILSDARAKGAYLVTEDQVLRAMAVAVGVPCLNSEEFLKMVEEENKKSDSSEENSDEA